jgi:hypothetical protein
MQVTCRGSFLTIALRQSVRGVRQPDRNLAVALLTGPIEGGVVELIPYSNICLLI